MGCVSVNQGGDSFNDGLIKVLNTIRIFVYVYQSVFFRPIKHSSNLSLLINQSIKRSVYLLSIYSSIYPFIYISIYLLIYRLISLETNNTVCQFNHLFIAQVLQAFHHSLGNGKVHTPIRLWILNSPLFISFVKVRYSLRSYQFLSCSR